MRVSLLPDYDQTNGWLGPVESLPDPMVLTGDIEADHIVVGGGFSGLAAARRLADLDPGASVVLIDGDRIGNNAAGRGSGIVNDLAFDVRVGTDAGLDAAPGTAGRSSHDVLRAGAGWLGEIVAREGIDCGWRSGIAIHAAASGRGARSLTALAVALEAAGKDHEVLDGEQLHARLGSDYYRSGLVRPETVVADPAALVRGLATSMPANVVVFENSIVTDIEYGPPHRLRTGRGSVAGPSLILAANGFGEGFGHFTNRLLPVIAWASSTRPLNDDEAGRLGGDDEYAIVPAHPAGTTVRRLAGRRILIANHHGYSRRSEVKKGRAAAAKSHRAAFVARYPMLREVEFEDTWGGALSLSHNGAGVCGEVGPGVWATMVHQGVGMARATASGRAVAELLAGTSPESIASLTQGSAPTNNRPELINRWAFNLSGRLQNRRAGRER